MLSTSTFPASCPSPSRGPARDRRSARPRPRRLVLALALVLGLLGPGAAWAGAAGGDAEPPVEAADPSGYTAPVAGSVVRGFDPPDVAWGAGHRGVDLASAVGATVGAPTDGVVTFAGRVAGRGVVTVLGDDGLRSSLEPVTPDVAVGDRVRRGDPVARVADDATQAGVGHCAPRACVHWGVRRGETYVDPMALLAGGPVVLLPTG